MGFQVGQLDCRIEGQLFSVHHIQQLRNQLRQTDKPLYLPGAVAGRLTDQLCRSELCANLAQSGVGALSLMGQGFHLHAVGKRPLAGENVLSLQVAVHHGNHGGIVVHFPDNGLDIRFAGKLRCPEPAVSGDDFKFAVLRRAYQNRVNHASRHDAVDGVLHQLVLIADFERVVFERPESVQREQYDLFRNLPFRFRLCARLFQNFLCLAAGVFVLGSGPGRVFRFRLFSPACLTGSPLYRSCRVLFFCQFASPPGNDRSRSGKAAAQTKPFAIS